MIFSEKKLKALREEVKKRLSEKRYLHTLAVAEAAKKLSDMCIPEKIAEAEVAALLHDVTKELSLTEQRELLESAKIALDSEDYESLGVLHSFTAPIVVKRDFPDFATEEVLFAVLYHTIGSPTMSVFDEIIFLADFIEDTRTYDSSVKLREFVWQNMQLGEIESNILILHDACVRAIDCTILNLIENKKKINSKNILTRNALLSKI